MLLDYDTSRAPIYPRDGLLCSATAIYRRVNGERHLSLISTQNRIKLNGSTFALNRDDDAPIAAMSRRGRARRAQRLSQHASSGFDARADRNFPDRAVRSEQGNRVDRARSAINAVRVHRINESDASRPGGERALSGLDILVRHGHAGVVQRAPIAPGTRADDSQSSIRSDRDFATRHIVVLGHSMGGLIAHTLGQLERRAVVETRCSWCRRSDCAVTRKVIRRFADGLHFRRNPRVVRAIFVATPHRGSNLAESWIGHIAASLIRLPTSLQTDIVGRRSANHVMPPLRGARLSIAR